MWALVTFIILHVLAVGIVLAKHGEPKGGNYNIFITLAAEALEFWLLYKAGLFDNFL